MKEEHQNRLAELFEPVRLKLGVDNLHYELVYVPNRGIRSVPRDGRFSISAFIDPDFASSNLALKFEM